MRSAPLPTGRTRFEPGSYGGFGEFRPSLLCYRETGRDSWEEHYCLVKGNVTFDNEDAATAVATKDLDDAMAAKDKSGNLADLAISLRHNGYKKLDDFHVVPEAYRQNKSPE
jgi:hypothetical protein